MNTPAPTNTYAFDAFAEPLQAAEWERLRTQATILFPKELAALEKVGVIGAHHLLEVGSGPGYLSEQFALHTPLRVTGIDTSAQFIARATREVATRFPQVAFAPGSIYAIPFADDTFDAAYARLLFQHLGEPVRALHELRRVVRPGGRVAIMDIDDGWFGMEPEAPDLAQLLRAARAGQATRGGDRLIGRKLPRYCQDAGLTQVTAEIVSVTTTDIPREIFLQLTTNFKQHIGNDPTLADATARIVAFARTQQAFCAVGIFCVTGVVP